MGGTGCRLGEHYLKAAPVWARLAVALAVFWSLAAVLYLTAGHNAPPFLLIVVFTAAAACLIVAIVAAGAVFQALKPEPLPIVPEGSQQPL